MFLILALLLAPQVTSFNVQKPRFIRFLRLPATCAMIEEVEMFRLHVMPHVTFHPRTVFTVCAVVTKAGTQIDHLRHYQLLMVAVSWSWKGKQNKLKLKYNK